MKRRYRGKHNSASHDKTVENGRSRVQDGVSYRQDANWSDDPSSRKQRHVQGWNFPTQWKHLVNWKLKWRREIWPRFWINYPSLVVLRVSQRWKTPASSLVFSRVDEKLIPALEIRFHRLPRCNEPGGTSRITTLLGGIIFIREICKNTFIRVKYILIGGGDSRKYLLLQEKLPLRQS